MLQNKRSNTTVHGSAEIGGVNFGVQYNLIDDQKKPEYITISGVIDLGNGALLQVNRMYLQDGSMVYDGSAKARTISPVTLNANNLDELLEDFAVEFFETF